MMQIFDGNWEAILRKAGLFTNLVVRYIDDGRAFMAPVSPGWRWEEGIKWQKEKWSLTPTERTRRVVAGSLIEVESFLKFTTESGENFENHPGLKNQEARGED